MLSCPHCHEDLGSLISHVAVSQVHLPGGDGERTFPPVTSTSKKQGKEDAAEAAVSILLGEEERPRPAATVIVDTTRI
ncbi:hypothetical protein QQF64_022439 [Cirrhinus molitorella]|uniref:Uncharacterized protein n=1 Tax=Cirrhinus molitorella TaxID=172907 RepID=A0ABR3L2H1_9TELE